MARIIIVDSNQSTRRKLERLLMDNSYRVIQVESGEMLLETLRQTPLDLVIMEAQLPGLGGLETLEKLRETNPRLPVIIFSQNATTEDVIKASKLGAFEYVIEPSIDAEMIKLVEMALETGRFTRAPVGMVQNSGQYSGDNLVGRSQPMQTVYKAIGRVAPTNATVLIRGESGTGKELVARAIYQHSNRASGPFVVVNCVAIPENLLESVLFGYEKGAFTGADRQRIGKIEYADQGTVFLDEIGDISLNIQAKLLRLLQERSIERIGGKHPIQADVRIIAATNADLESKMRNGTVSRGSLLPNKCCVVEPPSLRSRSDDIAMLADYFLAKFSHNLSVRNPGILPEAKDILINHNWPGNVRELANTIEKCLIFSKGHPIGQDDVAHLIEGRKETLYSQSENLDKYIKDWARKMIREGKNNLLSDMTNHVARNLIEETLSFFNGNRSQAARRLGISRPTLQKKIASFGIEPSFPDYSDK